MSYLRLHVPLSEARQWMRDGDLLLFRRQGLISALGRGEHGHAALAGWWGETLCCLEVRGRCGGRVVTLESQVRRYPGQIDVFVADPQGRWPEFDRPQTVQTMLQYAGSRYGYPALLRAGLLHLPLVRLFVRANTDDQDDWHTSAICSEACARATRLGGGVDPVPQLADEITEPADLARSPFYAYRATLLPDDEGGPRAAPQAALLGGLASKAGKVCVLGLVFALLWAIVCGTATGFAQGGGCPGGVCLGPSIPSQQGMPFAASPLSGLPGQVSQAVVRLKNQLLGGVAVYGSGVLVGKDDRWGWILTCDHLLRDGVGEVVVTFPSAPSAMGAATSYQGRVLGRDPTNDLALVGIAAPQNEPLPIASEAPPAGSGVFFAGYGPRGVLAGVNARVLGYVRAASAEGNETLQVTGGARDGDSGGPIVNARGEVVGILWGTDGFRTVGTYCGRIRAFLRGLLPSRSGEASPLPQGPLPQGGGLAPLAGSPPGGAPSQSAPGSAQGIAGGSPPPGGIAVQSLPPTGTETSPGGSVPAQSGAVPPSNGSSPVQGGQGESASPAGEALLARLQARLESLRGEVTAAQTDQQSLSDRLRNLESTLAVVGELRQRVEQAEQVVGQENVRAVVRETAADLLRERGPRWLDVLLPALASALGWTAPPSLALAFAARLLLRVLERRLREAAEQPTSQTGQNAAPQPAA